MIVRIVRPRNAIAVLVEDWLVLARVPGIEAVEVVEAEAIGPSVEGSDLTGFPDRRVVVFADPGRGVPILPQYFSDSSGTFRNEPPRRARSKALQFPILCQKRVRLLASTEDVS